MVVPPLAPALTKRAFNRSVTRSQKSGPAFVGNSEEYCVFHESAGVCSLDPAVAADGRVIRL